MEALQKSKLEDYQRCESLIRDTVKPSLLWREISQNLDAFSSTTSFDGGFELSPLISAGTSEAQFEVKGTDNFHKAIRELRNALSHGKDQKSGGVIVPTARNFAKLRPWVSLIAVATAEVIMYKESVA